MNKLVLVIACVSIYGLGFLHGNSSDSKLIGYIVCGIIGYFVGTAIYQYFKKHDDTRTRNVKTLDIIRENNMIPKNSAYSHLNIKSLFKRWDLYRILAIENHYGENNFTGVIP